MQNVNYAFVNSNEPGSIIFRSTVNSFGLDHVTDKDMVSFYANFSKFAYFDTGLLPVNGSGMLSIRSAGEHTQIAYQHAPGMYYINWGDYEGDRSATKYYVAQPYRIVIADMVNGNLLGARTFYSPVPITYPALPLYHVNLPNINCRGYRGNGVGWICLYHTEDTSQYPFNERVTKILDRCSGTEAYNDQNMSETDGPRFYRDNGAASHIYNPVEWQKYSEIHGVDWTLDENLWIPVLVKDLDNQEAHYENGQPLTFVDALFGNYKAYYVDELVPKPVNAIARSDVKLEPNKVFNWFKNSYNSSSTTFSNIDTFSSSLKVRENVSSTIFTPQHDDEESDEDLTYCSKCSEPVDNEYYVVILNTEQIVCQPCADEFTVYVEHLHGTLWVSDQIISSMDNNYYHLDYWNQYITCNHCGEVHVYDTSRSLPLSIINYWVGKDGTETYCCVNCVQTINFQVDENIENKGPHTCEKCGIYIPNIYDTDGGQINSFNVKLIKKFNTQDTFESNDLDYKLVGVCNGCYHSACTPLEKSISDSPANYSCVCGSKNNLSQMISVKQHNINFNLSSSQFPNINKDDLQNAHLYLIENKAHINSELFTELNTHEISTYVRIDHVCSECAYAIDFGGLNDYKNVIAQNLVSSINNELAFSQKLDTFYGLRFLLQHHF